MKTPAEKYKNDPEYYHLVCTLESLIDRARFTPSELREACVLACINYEMRHIRDQHIDPNITRAFEVFDDFLYKKRK